MKMMQLFQKLHVMSYIKLVDLLERLVKLMDTYLKKIVDDNNKIFKDMKNITKINVGFTNAVYFADDKYIIKMNLQINID